MLAKHLGEETVQPSMVLGCEQPITGYHETNFSMAYSSHISWQSATSPVPMEVYPSLAFDALFDNRGSKRNQSILDRVRDEAAGLSKKVSAGDRAKLDEYLTSVREVERRVVPMRKEQGGRRGPRRDRSRPRADDAPARERPARGHPRAHAADVRPDRAGVPDRQDPDRHAAALPRHLGPVLPVPRRPHRAPRGLARRQVGGYERVTQFYVGQLAYLASRLDAMPEGEGTVLDNTCLLFINSLFSGTKHDATKVPLVLAGGLGGTLETGRVLDYRGKGDDHRKLCSLYLGIMDRMGVKLDHFGDAAERLADL